jgi:hypothetical protein
VTVSSTGTSWRRDGVTVFVMRDGVTVVMGGVTDGVTAAVTDWRHHRHGFACGLLAQAIGPGCAGVSWVFG